jgi:hypothetical protein
MRGSGSVRLDLDLDPLSDGKPGDLKVISRLQAKPKISFPSPDRAAEGSLQHERRCEHVVDPE